MVNAFTQNPYMQSATSNNGIYQPTIAEQMAQQSFSTPYQVTPKQKVLGTDVGTTVEPTDMTGAPKIDLSNQQSNLQTGGSSLDATIKDMMAQLESIKTNASTLQQQQADAATADANKTPSAYDLIKENNQSTLDAITKLQAGIPTADEAMKLALSKYGLTEESASQIKDLNVQVADINKQIMDLNNRENQALDTIANRPGIDLAFMSGEQARISKAYAFQRADLVSKGSYALSIANALQGQWDKADKAATDYVTAATAKETNAVETLKWGATQFSTLISNMNTAEKTALQDAIKNAETERHNKVTEATDYINAETNRIKVLQEGTATTEVTKKEQQAKLASINDVNSIINDPAFSSTFGFWNMAKRNFPGSAEYNLKANIENFKSTIALAARGALKGQGTVSDFEGKMLEKAQTALQYNMSPEQALQELVNVRGAIATSSGLTATVEIKDMSTGESQLITADQAGINKAIEDGLLVTYK